MGMRIAAALVVGLGMAASPASAYTTIYSFGDSLSDVGNVYAASGGLYPVSPYFKGRFSNGDNWVDDLSAMMGLGPVEASANGGHDFAVGGAESGPTLVNPGTPLVDLNQQIKTFNAVDPSPTAGALYTLDIGANDIGAALSTLGSEEAALDVFLSQAVGNAVAAVGDLYAHGARALLYYEIPDLSVVPAFEKYGSLAGTLAKTFNDDFIAALAPLEADGLKVFDVPVFATIDQIVADPAKYGFTNVSSPCFSGGPTAGGTACADPNQYLFWDTEHPTAAAHLLTAEAAYDVLKGGNGVAAAPELSTWAMMATGFAALGFVAFRANRKRPIGA